MAFETPNSSENQFDRSDEAMQAARELVAENEILRDNLRVKTLMENDFVTADGTELDPGNFLAAMLAFVKSQEGGSINPEELEAAVERNLVTHSRPAATEMRGEDIDHQRAA